MRATLRARRRTWILILAPAAALTTILQLSLATSATGAMGTTASVSAHSVMPNPVSEVDCNGFSPTYKAVRQMSVTCVDPLKIVNGKPYRLSDNGHYIGHDEPSVKFISSAPGSGNAMTYVMRVPRSPRRAPTASGSVTNYGQLSPAPWFGLPICDPNSFPQNPCTPDSDSNIGTIGNASDAGSAFMELQFYPPGYTPFIDAVSCSATKWCSALNIDSLECNISGQCNPNCIEPVNFAYLQTNGAPAGPPSSQLADVSTMLPNRHTLMFNSGDTLVVSITDPAAGFTTVVRDLTTGQTGFMTASAANGFMNTSIADCSGTPFTFHAEYSTAKIQNQVPWAALEGGVLMQQEIGHSEVCSSLANKDPVADSFPGGQSYHDPTVFDTCNGGSEGPNATGEGPCVNGVCQGATTQGPSGPAACSVNNPSSNALCEFADGYCFPAGVRAVTINGQPSTEFSDANQCFADRFQNGDLDFDGLSYKGFAWPNGSPNHPQSFEYIGPFDSHGHTYPQVQFETDVAGSENLCNTATGAGCTAPPIGAAFYPFFSMNRVAGSGLGGAGTRLASCEWTFGNLPVTVSNFGKDAEYGGPDVARFAGTLTSPVLTNPEFSGRCAQ